VGVVAVAIKMLWGWSLSSPSRCCEGLSSSDDAGDGGGHRGQHWCWGSSDDAGDGGHRRRTMLELGVGVAAIAIAVKMLWGW